MTEQGHASEPERERGMFDIASEYFKQHLGEPDGVTGKSVERVFWSLPADGPRARMVRVELQRDTTDGGARLTVADPTAEGSRRFEMYTIHNNGQLDAGLALVVDHLTER